MSDYETGPVYSPEDAAKLLRRMYIGDEYWPTWMEKDPGESNGIHPIKTLITIAMGTEPQNFYEVYKTFQGTLDRGDLAITVNALIGYEYQID